MATSPLPNVSIMQKSTVVLVDRTYLLAFLQTLVSIDQLEKWLGCAKSGLPIPPNSVCALCPWGSGAG